MYCGLEVRVPFCDYRIAEYLYGVPWEYKDCKGREKGLLRCAFEGILPDGVLYRKKSPYPKTYDPQYETIAQERLNRILEDKNNPLMGILQEKGIRNALDSNSPWPWYGQLMRRPQTIAYMLQLEFWFRYYHVELLF